ncbi:MAG: DMT family transporter [Magnetovibrionaceae bacterium]
MTQKTLPTNSTDSGSLLAGMLYGSAAALIWSLWPIVSRAGVTSSMDAWDVTFLRFAVAGACLAPLLVKRGLGDVPWDKGLALACFAGAPYVLIAVGGLTFAPAGHGGVIIPSLMLVFSGFGAWWLMGERPDRNRMIGVAIILTGIALVGSEGFSRGGGQAWIGDLLFVVAGFLWASFTVLSRAWGVSPFLATALVSVCSILVYGPVYLFWKGPAFLEAPVAEIVLQAGFQGLGAGIAALFLYSRSLAILGAGRGAIFAAITPAAAVILAWPLLGEEPTIVELLGLVVVSSGMVLALNLHRSVVRQSSTRQLTKRFAERRSHQ